MKRALIVGVTGQDGAYLARSLLNKNYEIIGTSRDKEISNKSNLKKLGILNNVNLRSLIPYDYRSVLENITDTKPSHIFNLSGQTSVGLSFQQPVEAMNSISGGTLNFLEAIRYLNKDIKFFNAGSSECFGETDDYKANEDSRFKPCSPYALAKSTAFWQVENYRKAYGMFCCTGILSNHESPLRDKRFVTKKIINGIKDIKNGQSEKLILGNLNIYRDWGWAEEYVEAIIKIINHSIPEDFVVASGKSHSLYDFVNFAFHNANLDIDNHIEIDQSLFRPNEIIKSELDPSKINKVLNWESKKDFKQIIKEMFKG